MECRIKHDIYYLEHWSLWFDLKIIALTPLATIQNKNIGVSGRLRPHPTSKLTHQRVGLDSYLQHFLGHDRLSHHGRS